jgi:hypothetical protein
VESCSMHGILESIKKMGRDQQKSQNNVYD